MIRIKPRAPRGSAGAHRTARLRARTPQGEGPGATASFERPGTRRLRRALALGLPTVWGAVAVTYKLTCPLAQQHSLSARIVTSAVFFAVGTGLVLQVRHALLRELRQLREVAGAAQNVLLRPLPPRVDGLALAAGRLSATHGASVGGDLYEVAATDHGVRLVMGDVRGHGLAAIGTAAAVLGSFREAAHEADAEADEAFQTVQYRVNRADGVTRALVAPDVLAKSTAPFADAARVIDSTEPSNGAPARLSV